MLLDELTSRWQHGIARALSKGDEALEWARRLDERVLRVAARRGR